VASKIENFPIDRYQVRKTGLRPCAFEDDRICLYLKFGTKPRGASADTTILLDNRPHVCAFMLPSTASFGKSV